MNAKLLIFEVLTSIETALAQLEVAELMHALLNGVVDHLNKERP